MKKYLFLIFTCVVFTACDKEKDPELKPLQILEIVLSEDNCRTSLEYNYSMAPVCVSRVYYYLNSEVLYKEKYGSLFYSLLSPDGEVVMDRRGVNYKADGYGENFYFYQVIQIPVDEFEDSYEYKYGYTLKIEYYVN